MNFTDAHWDDFSRSTPSHVEFDDSVLAMHGPRPHRCAPTSHLRRVPTSSSSARRTSPLASTASSMALRPSSSVTAWFDNAPPRDEPTDTAAPTGTYIVDSGDSDDGNGGDNNVAAGTADNASVDAEPPSSKRMPRAPSRSRASQVPPRQICHLYRHNHHPRRRRIHPASGLIDTIIANSHSRGMSATVTISPDGTTYIRTEPMAPAVSVVPALTRWQQTSGQGGGRWMENKRLRLDTMSCSDAFQTAQTGLQALAHAIDRMVQGQLRAFVENNLLDLPEVVRRLLSHYGAVGGCSAGHQWKEKSHDGTNVIYSSVWEYWKGEEHYSKFWKCRSITNWNTAGKSPRTMPIDKMGIQDGFSEPSQQKKCFC